MPSSLMTVARCRRRAACAMAALLLVCAAGMPTTTAPATQPDPDAHDLELLHRLETGSWRDRQAAERELAQLGPADVRIVSALLARTTSPEARTRLRAVLKQLEDAKRVGTSLITLHYRNAPAKAVYASMFQQAWAPLHAHPDNLLDNLPPVTIDADREPFWTVFQRLSKVTGIGINCADRALGNFMLHPEDRIMPGPQVISGGFLVVLHRALPFVMPGNSQKCIRLDFFVYSEPKLDVQMMLPQVDISKATDDHGNALGQRVDSFQNLAVFGEGVRVVRVILTLPDKNPGTRLTRFLGALKASVALESARFDIADPANAKAQSVDIGGLALRFTGCKKVAPGRFQVNFDTGPDLKNRFQQIVQSTGTMRLIDANGRDMQCFSSSISMNPTVGNSMSYTFGAQLGDAAPARLVREIPTLLHTIDLPVNFQDIHFESTGAGSHYPDPEEDPVRD